MNNIRKQILWMSYIEHTKFAKEMQLYLPLNHPKRIKIEATICDIEKKINNQ